MNGGSLVQPERYYEACITHHLVQEWQIWTGQRLYPFSISQRREGREGYDFGYECGAGSFVVQYKRPQQRPGGGFCWRIDMPQLQALRLHSQPLRCYYILPAFASPRLWYEAPLHTRIVDAGRLQHMLQPENGRKSRLLHEGAPGLYTLAHWLEQTGGAPQNVAVNLVGQTVAAGGILTALGRHCQSGAWLYAAKEEEDAGSG